MVEWKQSVKGDFFEIKLLVQPDVVFDSESNDCNFSSLAPPKGEKKYFQFCFLLNDVTSGRGRFSHFFSLKWKIEKVIFFSRHQVALVS